MVYARNFAKKQRISKEKAVSQTQTPEFKNRVQKAWKIISNGRETVNRETCYNFFMKNKEALGIQAKKKASPLIKFDEQREIL